MKTIHKTCLAILLASSAIFPAISRQESGRYDLNIELKWFKAINVAMDDFNKIPHRDVSCYKVAVSTGAKIATIYFYDVTSLYRDRGGKCGLNVTYDVQDDGKLLRRVFSRPQ